MHNKGPVPNEVIEQMKQAGVTPLKRWRSPVHQKKQNPSDPPIYDEILFTTIKHNLWSRIQDLILTAESKGQIPKIDEINERIFTECVLWPNLTIEEIKALPVGFIPSITKIIEEASGLIDTDILGRPLAPDTNSVILKDFEYWPDITKQDLEAIKQEHKFTRIYKVTVGNFIFVIRPMTRVDIMGMSPADDQAVALCKSVTLWPKEVPWDDLPYGTIQALGRMANKVSGWEVEGEIEEL